MDGPGQDVATSTMDGWAWSGCGHSEHGRMGAVRMWPQWQWMGGRGQDVATCAMDGYGWDVTTNEWAWSRYGCIDGV